MKLARRLVVGTTIAVDWYAARTACSPAQACYAPDTTYLRLNYRIAGVPASVFVVVFAVCGVPAPVVHVVDVVPVRHGNMTTAFTVDVVMTFVHRVAGRFAFVVVTVVLSV